MHEASKTCPQDYGTRPGQNLPRYSCPRRCIVCEFCNKEFSSDAIEVRTMSSYCLLAFEQGGVFMGPL